MTFLIKKAYGPLVILLCALSNSYAHGRAVFNEGDRVGYREPKVSRGEGYECDFSNEPKVVDWMSAQEAYTAGEDAVKFAIKYCISLGQGNFFQDLKEMLVKGYALKNTIERIRGFGSFTNLTPAFVKGFTNQLEKENVHEFVKQARFTEWQKKIVIDSWEFALKDLRVLTALDPRDWRKYSQDHALDYAAFFANILAAVSNELRGSQN